VALRQITSTDAPQPAGAYSQGVVANGFLYTAGFGPIDPHSGTIVGDTIEEQTELTLRNLGAVLRETGLDYSDVVKVTVHLHELARDFAGFDATYRQMFSTPLPVRTTVGSTLAGILVEIDAVAALRQSS
jgi:2-iminobutanoate/2-iminopropanoate deaminase